jgi:hypothetical protein
LCYSINELYNFLGKIKSDEISLVKKENEIVFRTKGTKVGLTLQNEIKLPLDEIGKIKAWKDLPETFLDAIKMTIECCSKDMSRPVLTCINVSEKGYLESTDAFRIVHYNIMQNMPVKTFLLPQTSAIIVDRLKPTQIAEGNGWIHFKTEQGTVLSCRIFVEKFPDCSPLLNVEGETLIFPDETIEMIDKAEIFAKRDCVLDESITINIENNVLTIKSKSETGWCQTTKKLKDGMADINFSITPYLLKDILKKDNTCIINKKMVSFKGDVWQYVSMLRIKEKDVEK